MRIDKWLWAARFFKTRTIAQEEVGLGRVHIDGQRMKASRDVRVGDRLTIRRGEETFHVFVEGLSNTRGPAAEAQKLYRETEESKMTRAQMKEMLRLASEHSSGTTDQEGRPPAEGMAAQNEVRAFPAPKATKARTSCGLSSFRNPDVRLSSCSLRGSSGRRQGRSTSGCRRHPRA